MSATAASDSSLARWGNWDTLDVLESRAERSCCLTVTADCL